MYWCSIFIKFVHNFFVFMLKRMMYWCSIFLGIILIFVLVNKLILSLFVWLILQSTIINCLNNFSLILREIVSLNIFRNFHLWPDWPTPHLRNEMCGQYVPRRSQRVKPKETPPINFIVPSSLFQLVLTLINRSDILTSAWQRHLTAVIRCWRNVASWRCVGSPYSNEGMQVFHGKARKRNHVR